MQRIALFSLAMLFLCTSLLTGCDGCYDSEDEAWAACNKKYSGKCSYLGPKYKVCRAAANTKTGLLAEKTPLMSPRDFRYAQEMNVTVPDASSNYAEGGGAFDRGEHAGAPTYNSGDVALNDGDYVTALKIFQPLVNEGNALAQEKLGDMHEKGLGVEQSYVKAVHFYRLAARQGNGNAQAGLSFLYANGFGVDKDYVRAYMWDRIGRIELDALDAAESEFVAQMTQAQIEQGEKMLKECHARKFSGCD